MTTPDEAVNLEAAVERLRDMAMFAPGLGEKFRADVALVLSALSASNARAVAAEEALRDLLAVMEMQERRNAGEFHLSAEAFMPIWERAKDRARTTLATMGGQTRD